MIEEKANPMNQPIASPIQRNPRPTAALFLQQPTTNRGHRPTSATPPTKPCRDILARRSQPETRAGVESAAPAAALAPKAEPRRVARLCGAEALREAGECAWEKVALAVVAVGAAGALALTAAQAAGLVSNWASFVEWVQRVIS